jgi:hypothetical protein
MRNTPTASDWLLKFCYVLVAKLDELIPQPFADELRGIAQVSESAGKVMLLRISRKSEEMTDGSFSVGWSWLICTGVTLGKLVLMNLIYDLSAGCTSIVAQTSNGRMLHARNLDYGTSTFVTFILGNLFGWFVDDSNSRSS